MREGMAQSCNAYFANLAVQVGADGLASTAAVAGIPLTAPGTANLRDTLPHAGYGQGEVLATPLRMARVAAAIASDGTLRDSSMVRGGSAAVTTRFVPVSAADRLASYLRDAVVSGTGRLLKDHPGRIAGKTGTAEVDEAESHAWFVGFAPYGTAQRRIAFAVVIENAGYGGGVAAAVAGQLVSAAAAVGYLR